MQVDEPLGLAPRIGLWGGLDDGLRSLVVELEIQRRLPRAQVVPISAPPVDLVVIGGADPGRDESARSLLLTQGITSEIALLPDPLPLIHRHLSAQRLEDLRLLGPLPPPGDDAAEGALDERFDALAETAQRTAWERLRQRATPWRELNAELDDARRRLDALGAQDGESRERAQTARLRLVEIVERQRDELAALRRELETSRDTAARLESELDTVRATAARLQNELDTVRATAARLQNELDAMRAEFERVLNLRLFRYTAPARNLYRWARGRFRR